MQLYPGSSARVVRLSLRRVFVVLLARGSSLPVVLVLESERCCVEDVPVNFASDHWAGQVHVPGSSWPILFRRCNLSSHCHLMGSVRCRGMKLVSC